MKNISKYKNAFRKVLFAVGRWICHPKLWVAVYIALAVAVLWRTPESAGHLGTTDSIEYATSAVHFTQGKGLTVNAFGEVHPSRYPPGYPVLFLAPLYALDASFLGIGIYSVVASGIAFAFLLLILCFQFLPLRQASCAATITLGVTLCIFKFDWVSRMIMSDIPGIFLFFVTWTAWIVRKKNLPASYLVAGIATAIAVSMRVTHLAICIPHLVSLLYMRPLPLLLRSASLLLVPIVSSFALQMIYYQHVFGSPFFTGYHYWLPPDSYSLRLDVMGENLWEMVHIFSPPWERTELRQWMVGPVVVAYPLLAAWACRKWRPELWMRTKEAFVSLGQISLPILLFYACYPFSPTRFILSLHIAWLALGVVWTLSFCNKFSKWGLLAVFVIGGRHAYAVRGYKTYSILPSYRHTLMAESNTKLPQDALLIGHYSSMAADYFFVGDSERSFLPIQNGFRTHVGAEGEERRVIYEATVENHPERIEEAFDAGRRVFLMTELTRWHTNAVILNQLLERYRSESTFVIRSRAAVVELFRII
jgi:hypothetical protein